MRECTPDEAIAAIADGSNVILPHGAVEPTSLYAALSRGRDRFRGLTLYSGLQFGPYPFLDHGLGENFGYVTWQAAPRLRPLFRAGRIDLLPLRYRDVVRVVRPGGGVAPDVVIVQVSTPRRGRVSLGISCSLYRDFIAGAGMVIAEMHADMPWTCGETEIDLGDLDVVVESEAPLGTYSSPRQSERDARIIDRVLEMMPAQACVQLGVGAVPDALLPRLHEVEGVSLHSGMLSEGLVEFLGRARHRVRVITGEVAGSAELYRFVADNPQIEFRPSTMTHDLRVVAELPRFVSVNSAVEVDLQGQINGETIDGVQISGVGGSLDFVEGAAYSAGGMSIVALPSTTEDRARSKIVARLGAETPVTIPRYCADVVVTEHGVARLRGKTLRQRAEALVGVAHPSFRASLEAALR